MAKTDFKAAVLDYLIQNSGNDISRDELVDALSISKSRLCEVIKSIQADGYNIICPPRSGKLRLETSEQDNILPPLKDSDLRKWLIIFFLSFNNKLTFDDLVLKFIEFKDPQLADHRYLRDITTNKKAYSNSALIKCLRDNLEVDRNFDIDTVAKDIVSVTALRNDLVELRKQHIVCMKKSKHTYYSLDVGAPKLLALSENNLLEFCHEYQTHLSTMGHIAPLETAYEKIKRLIDYTGDDFNIRSFGKQNDLDQAQIAIYKQFMTLPYKTHVLQITSTYEGTEILQEFSVCLVYYSVEVGAFYLLGKNLTSNRIEFQRLEYFMNGCPKALPKRNTEILDPRYNKILSEMFSTGYSEELYQVKVLVQNFSNVKERFESLTKIRPKAELRKIDNPPEDCIYQYVYTDTLRGLDDFARFLRGFGYSVLAVSPAELKSKMEYSYNRIISKYGEFDIYG